MSKTVLNGAFIFDANYLSPALVSVASLFQILGGERLPVTLIFLVGADETENQKIRFLLQRFDAGIKSMYPAAQLEMIELRGSVFDDYVKRLHFSSAILYKAIIPQVLPHLKHIVLFDCGMIFGRRVHDFLLAVENQIERRAIAPVAAFCVPSAGGGGDLSDELRNFPHNALYPAAGTLYFDVDTYKLHSIYDRLISVFHLHRERLIYAEQDLMCLTLENDELSTLPECGARAHIDLASTDWSESEQHERVYGSRDCYYIKHVGSFKPWKKWVLHPSKRIFLEERSKVGALIGAENLIYLRDDELFPQNAGFLAQQLVQMEAYYERPFCH